jgi:hypothetical protein
VSGIVADRTPPRPNALHNDALGVASRTVDTLRLPASLASLVAANVAPLAGILLLGWSPVSILILYFVDTLLSLGVVMLLVMMHVTGNAQGRRFSGFQDWAQGIGALVFLGAIFALPLSLPLWFIGPGNIGAEFERPDSGLLYGILLQTAMSALAAVRMHRDLEARDDDDRVLVRRGLYVLARWVSLFLAIGTGLVELLGARWGAFVLVAIYAGASVYFELHPERAERLLRGTAKPISYQPDLDGPRGDAPPSTQRATYASPMPSAQATEPDAKRKRVKRVKRRQRG